ncbi:hypothetical protein GCM10027048_05130 [Hymenobacter coalescens]
MTSFPALLSAFNALPGAYVLLTADLRIEAVSDAYLTATLTRREQLLGEYMFDAFPDNPAVPEARSVRNLQASLARVLATGQPHEMPRQHYDVPDPAHPGRFVERYWLVRNIPLPDEQGQTSHILHVAQDVTAQVQAETSLQDRRQGELAAQAEAEVQRARLHALLTQAPVPMASLRGPQHRVDLANERFRELFGNRAMVGLLYEEAVPELKYQAFFDLLDEVYRTGETYHGSEQLAYIDRTNSGRPEPLYFTFIYQATRDVGNKVTGIVIVAHDVTEQVEARQQVQALNQELAAANEELQAANAEFWANNAELISTQQQLHRLNGQLEARVLERTDALQQARAETERQRQRLESLFMQAPAAICILEGPELVYRLVNPGYQQLFPGRVLLGRPLLAALPEIAGHEVYRTFRRVYETGLTHRERAMLIPLTRPDGGALEDRYFDYIQQARYDEQGRIDGVLVFAFEVSEQVRARQASEAAAQQLELLTDALPVLISYVDRAHTYRFANRAYETWFGLTPEQLVGRPAREVIGEAAYGRVAGYMARALAGEWVDFEATMPYREGFTRHIHTSYVPDMRDGVVGGFYSLVADVTEQVEARQQVQALNEELRASNRELRRHHAELARSQQAVLDAAQRRAQERETLYQVFEQTPACIALLRGPEHRFEYVNAAYQQLFPGRQLVGLPLAEALPETTTQGFLAWMNKVYETGETFFGNELLLRVQQADGRPAQDVYFTFTYQAYHENGTVVGISIFAYDVTEQVLARQERETERQRLHGLFMQAPAGICILNGPELIFEFVNPGYQQLLPGRTLVGRPILEAMPEISGTQVETLLRRAYDEGQTHEAQGLLISLARGSDAELEDRYFTFVYQPRRDAQQRVNGVLVFVFEVSEQVAARRAAEASAEQARALAEELGATNEQLTRTNVDLDTFIYTASHDLKEPITNLDGLVRELQSQLPEAAAHPLVPRLLTMMQDAVKRFQLTIAQLTDLAQLQQARPEPAEVVDVAAVVEAVSLDLAASLAAAEARLQVEVAAGLTVTFAPKHLRSIVYNLLSNAVKYRYPGRPLLVQLRCFRAAGDTVLEVQDNGLGLHEWQRAKLFRLFQRLHAHVEGSGMGLYILKRIVDNAGGRIEVDTQPAIGSTFRVTLPG